MTSSTASVVLLMSLTLPPALYFLVRRTLQLASLPGQTSSRYEQIIAVINALVLLSAAILAARKDPNGWYAGLAGSQALVWIFVVWRKRRSTNAG